MHTLSSRICLLMASLVLSISAAKAESEPTAETAPAAEKRTEYTLSGPYTHANLSIFLIHGAAPLKDKQFLTLDEALEQKKIVVNETGQVNQLTVENVSEREDVFIQSGDIVKGGRQDRVLAFDLIVPPKSGPIPVDSFCVEHGRWTRRGRESAERFASSKDQLASKYGKLAVKGGLDGMNRNRADDPPVRSSAQLDALPNGGLVQTWQSAPAQPQAVPPANPPAPTASASLADEVRALRQEVAELRRIIVAGRAARAENLDGSQGQAQARFDDRFQVWDNNRVTDADRAQPTPPQPQTQAQTIHRQEPNLQIADGGNTDLPAQSTGLNRRAVPQSAQGAVWQEVAAMQTRLSSNVGEMVNSNESSSSLQLSLEHKRLQELVAEYIKELQGCTDGQDDVIGYAFAINGTVNSADVYANGALFRKLWPKLLKSSAVEAIAELKKDKPFDPVTPETVLACLKDAQAGKTSASKEVNGRVRMLRRETDKNLLFETIDRQNPDAAVHFNFMTKM